MTEMSAERLSLEDTLTRIARYSPYLQRLVEMHGNVVESATQQGYESALSQIMDTLNTLHEEHDKTRLMQQLRLIKQRISLLIAMADISNHWNVETTTRYLSDFADQCVRLALDFCLRPFSNNAAECGYAIFAVGKLGSQALNYSSDIDLIMLFERESVQKLSDKDPQALMNKLTQDIISLLHERTVDGYVFRVDLRVRPDPSSTPPAVSLLAALNYYETVGQNWERAALIKTRFIAGDAALGEMFLKELRPFLWRKHLDFATIDDIHSIKRQMHTGTGEISTIRKHNVKTGRGGIREIEFFVQTQQLIWGGRFPELRTSGTIESLLLLRDTELVEPDAVHTLSQAYYYLRRLEHRLQMVNDQQTHTIPDEEEALSLTAAFMGFEGLEQFSNETLGILREVHRLFLDSMQSTPSLAEEQGALVFTGSEPDPETLETLTRMGYRQARTVSDMIQGWHRGHRRATRSKRSRQILTEIIPSMLKAMATTSHPDSAFIRLDDFLSQLPAGVQIFSLMASNPTMLDTLATVMGSAPALGQTLGKHPYLLEAIIHSDFTRLPTPDEIEAMLRPQLEHALDYEDAMRILRLTRSEREFQAGVALLKGTPAREVNIFLSELAEDILHETLRITHKHFAQKHGQIEGGSFAVLALGKLGAKELTFGSDLDIFFIYDAEEEQESTGGESTLPSSVYYNRLAQRVVSALTTLTREGRLYEVDGRMRPLGDDGPLASKLSTFAQYYTENAWTFEHMALCKARVTAGDSEKLRDHINDTLRTILTRGYKAPKVMHDASHMRQRIATQFRNRSGWNIKHAAGGTMDFDFTAQTLLLCHAHDHPNLLQVNSEQILAHAQTEGLLSQAAFSELKEAIDFQQELQCLLRLCTNESIPRAETPPGLSTLLQQRFDAPSLDVLFSTLRTHQQLVRDYCDKQLALAE